MKTRILAIPTAWALVVTAALAQKPPANPGKPNDAAALEEAIRAVDRAKEKAVPETKPATPVAPPAVKPEPAKPAKADTRRPATPGAKPSKAKPTAAIQTQISGLEDAQLDNARNVVVFKKNVVVDRPDLKIWCDQLEIALNRGPAKPPKDKPAPSGREPDAFGADSIKSATAIAPPGGLVVIWRKTETGDVVAVGRQAVYTAASGAFTITGLPEVLREMNFLLQSPGESDKIVIYKNGNASLGKKNQANLPPERAKEIRQRMFSHVPGKRPSEATESGESAPDPPAPEPTLPAPPVRPSGDN